MGCKFLDISQRWTEIYMYDLWQRSFSHPEGRGRNSDWSVNSFIIAVYFLIHNHCKNINRSIRSESSSWKGVPRDHLSFIPHSECSVGTLGSRCPMLELLGCSCSWSCSQNLDPLNQVIRRGQRGWPSAMLGQNWWISCNESADGLILNCENNFTQLYNW